MTSGLLGDRVLVKPAPKEEKTSSGLYISSGAQEKPQRGKVVAVGEGKRDQDGNRFPVDVKAGDEVFYGKFGATRSRSTARTSCSSVRTTSTPLLRSSSRELLASW